MVVAWAAASVCSVRNSRRPRMTPIAKVVVPALVTRAPKRWYDRFPSPKHWPWRPLAH